MAIYDFEGNEVQVEPFVLKAKNYGYINSPGSYFGSEVSANGDGIEKFIPLNGIPFTNSEQGEHIIYVSAKVRCTAACHIRIYSGTISQAIIDATPTQVSNYTQKVDNTVAEGDIEANTDYYITGTVKKTVTTTGVSKQIQVLAEFASAADAAAATLTANYGVCVELSEVFGAGYELDALTMDILMSAFPNRYFSDETNIVTDAFVRALKTRSALLERPYSQYVRDGEYGNVEIGGTINKDWPNWNLSQWSYGNSKNLCPVPTMMHGKVHTDGCFSVVPLWGNWGREAVTVGDGPWGGHVFHGWNDAMTFRLTMMASGGMTAVDERREDEFCIHVFSPDNAYNNPIGLTPEEAQNRITLDPEDRFSGSAWYGRIRIGADKGDEGFVFRAKSLTCFGRVDLNGQKFILGDQTANIPATSSSTGKQGQICQDTDYLYICVADNSWKRIPLETF